MRLLPVSRGDLLRRLKDFGWEGPISGGRHQFMVKGQVHLTIPNPHGHDIGVNLLKVILREAGISREDWLKLR
jgi:predicted RNA binding protein YcfA (HicA-like mRNA interferase family)